jgi:retron-type reverse transcriptase
VFDGRYNKTDKGVPQGSIIGPILSNIYLHNFDLFMKQLKETEDSGLKRKSNPAYNKIIRQGKHSAKYARKHRILPLKYKDPSFKRIIYVRYADDFIIGVDGSKESANKILGKVISFLTQNLKFELKEPIEVTHYRTTRTKFLGVYLKGNRQDLVPTISYLGRKARSPVRPLIIMPIKEIKKKLLELKFVTYKGKI